MVDSLAKVIDHTALKPDVSRETIKTLCEEAKTYGFASVCVNPYWVPYCAELLKDTDVMVCTVIGFPLGATLTEVKAFETRQSIDQGAGEVDMVINIGAMKDGDETTVLEDIAAVVKAAKGRAAVKVILETCLLTDDEIEKASLLAKKAGADFVKTSTGFSTGGATVDAVKRMRSVVGQEMGVKASGGIRTRETAEAMIQAGASRIGASASVAIVTNQE
ncbi:deoxyribose-phosphate aldolase [Pullulanibacillus sp. KACC 23026]|uniref:deoxyribose-phosphate aldolase n=1 Tax=Pullulanibacillus sp. KACC 23026 TaxID=3028315 RepID=UPI0023B0C9A9|nr:deoxyribose-phosphate aldolase [Pullulanibacillus sp. KACC 23026]WEG14226.1 deoxyribose-phosphate aldolase [Pullulanibacillus sp. KACC 23026]